MRPTSSTLRRRRVDDTGQAPVEETAMRSESAISSSMSSEIDKHHAAGVAERDDLAMDKGRAADVDAAGRLRGDEDAGRTVELARDGQALLVAAGEASGTRLEAAVNDRKARQSGADMLGDAGRAEDAAGREFLAAMAPGDEIVLDRGVERQAFQRRSALT